MLEYMRDRTGKRLRLVEETYPTTVPGIRLEVGEDHRSGSTIPCWLLAAAAGC